MIKVVRQVQWRNEDYPITIAELPSASKDLARILTEQERNDLSDFLAFNPACGDIIQRTGGIRKARWYCCRKGKRSGLRVIYYFRDLNMPLYILAVYAKGEKINITPREERMLSKLVEDLVSENAIRSLGRLATSDRTA